MAKIPLRVYVREIEETIEEGQYEEAIAHCRHILQTFPKHVDTYRQLGKAFLEAQQYNNAEDIFERLLSAVPDDFVAHLGMSIIREDKNNVDAAIWHMERAFEQQPYNPAIQEELRRLYGKRDGITPPKARLTPGALARTYAKGGHYPQAIAELRASLAQEPDRIDLLVLLAEVYARHGDTVHAIETCSQILKKLPYCLQANRLLAELLKDTDREAERQACLKRLYELDPYEAHTSPQHPRAEDVPDQAVLLERLTWDGQSVVPTADQTPDWAASLGLSLQSGSQEEALPEWLEEGGQPESEEELIPDWMREAGWQPASGEASEEPMDFDFPSEPEDEDEEAVPAELPDWLKEMAPEGMALSAEEEESTLPEEEDLSDLEALLDASLSTEEQPSPEIAAGSSDEELPDWLEGIAETEEDTGPEFRLDETPDWLEDVVPGAEEEHTGFTDILKEVGGEQPAEGEVPDWLSGLEEEAPAEEA
ncbi:MAG: hypothetical protein D6803_02685, partial [Anaerolineae bacterium]